MSSCSCFQKWSHQLQSLRCFSLRNIRSSRGFLVYRDSLSSGHSLSFLLGLLRFVADILYLLGGFLVFVRACLFGIGDRGCSFRCGSLNYSDIPRFLLHVGICGMGLLLLNRFSFYCFVLGCRRFLSVIV